MHTKLDKNESNTYKMPIVLPFLAENTYTANLSYRISFKIPIYIIKFQKMKFNVPNNTLKAISSETMSCNSNRRL